MPDRCNLWVNLASAGPRAHLHAEPTAYLQFPATGLLIGLPDEPGILLEPMTSASQFIMRDEDAEGLGLNRDDLRDGVVLCRTDAGAVGWRCQQVNLLIDDAAGELHTSGWTEFGASTGDDGTKPARQAPSRIEAPATTPQRMLVWVKPSQSDRSIETAAREARARGASVILAAVGELPETALHAAEERAVLAAMLDEAASFFDGPIVGTCMELGGDPVHALLTLADEEDATIVAIPEGGHRYVLFERSVAREIEKRGGRPVLRLLAPHAAPTSRQATASLEGAARLAPGEWSLSIEGFPTESTPEVLEAWRALVLRAAAETPGVPPVLPDEFRYALTAIWKLRAGTPTRIEALPLLPLIEMLRAAEWLPRDASRMVAMRSEFGVPVSHEPEQVEVRVHVNLNPSLDP